MMQESDIDRIIPVSAEVEDNVPRIRLNPMIIKPISEGQTWNCNKCHYTKRRVTPGDSISYPSQNS